MEEKGAEALKSHPLRTYLGFGWFLEGGESFRLPEEKMRDIYESTMHAVS